MPDSVKPSRMELRLEAQIAVARTSIESDCRRAELAAYHARLGRFEEARQALDVLRQRNQQEPRIELSAWMHFAEGILAYFSNLGVSKADGVQRAYAICSAAGLNELRAICAAWLAQWDYARVDMNGLARHLREALEIAGPTNHSARSRANLVAAQALHVSARPDLAQGWYRRSREHAIADQDDVTISALMHNMAWIRMLCMRQVALTGDGDLSAGRHALMNAESTAHFDEMLGDASWQELKPILRAQILSLQGESAGALSLYDHHLSGISASSRLQMSLIADKAWCHADLGNLEAAREYAEQALLHVGFNADADDRAAAHSRLAQVFAVLGDEAESARHQGIARANWATHAEAQAEAVRLLSSLDGSC